MSVGVCPICGQWAELYRTRPDGNPVCDECVPNELEHELERIEDLPRDMDVWDDDGTMPLWIPQNERPG